MKKLMEETVDGWHEMENKKVVMVVVVVVVEEMCVSAGIQTGAVEKLYRRQFIGS